LSYGARRSINLLSISFCLAQPRWCQLMQIDFSLTSKSIINVNLGLIISSLRCQLESCQGKECEKRASSGLMWQRVVRRVIKRVSY
jgi:hypothetical protein